MLTLGHQKLNFTIFFLQVLRSLTSHCLLSHHHQFFSKLSYSPFIIFLRLAWLATLQDMKIHDCLQPSELWKVWCLLLPAGFLFTPLCPDSLLTLQFTLCGKQDRTLYVGFPSSWHSYRPPTKADDNAQQPQHASPTKLHMRVNNRVQNTVISMKLLEGLLDHFHKITFLVSQGRKGNCSSAWFRY